MDAARVGAFTVDTLFVAAERLVLRATL